MFASRALELRRRAVGVGTWRSLPQTSEDAPQTCRCGGVGILASQLLPEIQLLPVIQLLRLSFSSHSIMLVEVVRVEEVAHYAGQTV